MQQVASNKNTQRSRRLRERRRQGILGIVHIPVTMDILVMLQRYGGLQEPLTKTRVEASLTLLLKQCASDWGCR